MRRTSGGPWAVVALVGIVVVGLVLGLGLKQRLSSGQDLLDDAKPAFTADRAAGATAGVNIVSSITDMAQPVTTKNGAAVAEVPKLIALVSAKTGLSQKQVLAALTDRYPHTTALLQAIPLSAVTKELPQLVDFLATALKTTPAKVQEALATNFPALSQAIGALPKVTGGFDAVPGTQGFTRFNGSPVSTVPTVRDYFGKDLVPVVARQHENLTDLTKKGGIGFLPTLLLIVGIVVTVFGIGMAFRASGGGLTRAQATAGWATVIGVGAVVVVLVLGLNLFGRLSGGNDLLKDARPGFTEQRVAGARAGIDIISDVADLTQPITTAQGGASAEVPKLIAFVAKGTGLSQKQVVAVLGQKFPHTAALLQSLPLSDVTSELPGLQKFLAQSLGMSATQLGAALTSQFPGLAQVITALPKVTGGYENVPGTAKLTRFNGTPVRTVPQVRDYFSKDVIPVLERQQQHFQDLDDPWPPVTVFPPLLLIVGLLVVAYGGTMLAVERRRPEPPSSDGDGDREPSRDGARELVHA